MLKKAREFTFNEIARHACGIWRSKAKRLMDEFKEKKNRTKFTFMDVVTNSSINDEEHDEIFIKMVEACFRSEYIQYIYIEDVDEWLFGNHSFLNIVGGKVYREIMYSLMKDKKFERLLEEYREWYDESD
jgi:hypothetical protein